MISRRVLAVDFAQFSDEDPSLKGRLIDLMIDNLIELEQGYYLSARSGDASFLLKTYHKVTTTLKMLQDKELDAVVEDLKDPDLGPAAISHYKRIKAEITSSLLAEKSC